MEMWIFTVVIILLCVGSVLAKKTNIASALLCAIVVLSLVWLASSYLGRLDNYLSGFSHATGS